MGYLHYLWTQDAYVGFIDPVPGHLGLAGWWHLGFSIVESAGIVVFLGLWLRSRRLPGAEAFRHGFTVWVPFLAYSALSVLDFVVSHRLILPRHPEVVSAWWTNWEALMILPFSLSVYVIGNILSAHDGSRLTRRDKKPEVPRGMEAHAGVVMPHGLKTKLTDRPITKREELLLNLHIAEYSALMARATNWLTLESGIWLLMVGFVAILPNLWNSLPQHLIVWGSFGVLLIMLFVWSNMTYDHYTSVRYIEHELRSSIIGVIGPARFWRYEAFIAPTRPKNQPFWFEAAPAFGSFGVLAALAAYRFPRRQPWDYIEFGIDLLLWCFYLWFTLRMVKVRQDLYKIETDLGPEDTNPGSGKEAQKP